jgi:hypothetical protein
MTKQEAKTYLRKQSNTCISIEKANEVLGPFNKSVGDYFEFDLEKDPNPAITVRDLILYLSIDTL